MKLTTGVNFAKILQAVFHINVFCDDLFYVKFSFEIVWCKSIGAKAAGEILVILTAGFNVTNIL
jgi:hypothetical protein